MAKKKSSVEDPNSIKNRIAQLPQHIRNNGTYPQLLAIVKRQMAQEKAPKKKSTFNAKKAVQKSSGRVFARDRKRRGLTKKDIEKAFTESKHRRDRFGRFATKMTTKQAKALIEHTANFGGFTLDFKKFGNYPGNGYGVGVGAKFGGAKQEPFEGITPERLSDHINNIKRDIVSLVMKAPDLSNESKDRVHFGGWHNTENGDLYVEPSLVFERDEFVDAVQLAVDQDEIAIFDFETFQDIKIADLDLEALGVKKNE